MKLFSAGALTLVLLPSGFLFSDSLYQTNLVADTPGVAQNTDTHLKDAWGMSFSATSPIWVNDRASGVATVYKGDGTALPLVVTVPPGMASTGPTGQVYAGPGTSFMVNGAPALFIFDTLGGTIDAWNGSAGSTAQVMATSPGSHYEGLALANNTLYASYFQSGGDIDVYNSSFTPVTPSGTFKDPNIPSGYAPFNVQNINGKLYVTYAKVTPGVPVPLPGGGGYVDVFDTNGNLLKRLVSNGMLDAPWGMTMAPSTWGSFAGDLLVGNFGNGEINAYDPTNGSWLGTLTDISGTPFVNSGLWTIAFGNSSANPNALYFTAGPDSGAHGLFGDITTVPEPAAFGLAVIGIMGLLGYAGQRRRKARRASPLLQ